MDTSRSSSPSLLDVIEGESHHNVEERATRSIIDDLRAHVLSSVPHSGGGSPLVRTSSMASTNNHPASVSLIAQIAQLNVKRSSFTDIRQGAAIKESNFGFTGRQ